MRPTILFLIVALFSTVGLCQNPRWKIADESPIPARADIYVRWEAAMTNIPQTLSIYRLVPHRFSLAVISNVVALCDFSFGSGLSRDKNALHFKSAAGNRSLVIGLTSAAIHYETTERRYGPTNLAKGVPPMDDLPRLVTNFLKELEIPATSVTGYFEGEKFNFSEPLTMYYVGDETITNIEFRSIKFRRSVDGIPVAGGDSGSIEVGEGGKLKRVDLEWHDLAWSESRPAISKERIVSRLPAC